MRREELGRTTGLLPQIDADAVSMFCDTARQMALRLDIIAELLRKLKPDVVYGTEIYMAELIELMRLDLASMPRDHGVVSVASTATPIVQNTTPGPVPYIVTNLDNAQMLHYGVESISATTGPIIKPKDSLKIIVQSSEELKGIVGGANIDVAVSRLFMPA